jgi:DNA polymerase-3 subunit alpha
MIRFGLRGIARVSNDLIYKIMKNRPYSSLHDFLSKVKTNKLQATNLIKSGALDCFGPRAQVMKEYIKEISGAKKRITLQNMRMLIEFELIPEEFDFSRRVFNYNKYLKKSKKDNYFEMDNIAFNFFEKNFDIDILEPSNSESGFKVSCAKWDLLYKKEMNRFKPYMKEHQEELLEAVNDRLIKDMWDKYCEGNISYWEMKSICCYIHEHELKDLEVEKYGIDRFGELPDEPVIEKIIKIKGHQVPIYKINRIIGTVLDKDKMKSTVTILTTDGVVEVKIYGAFANYDRQISEVGADGKKHVIRKSEFQRGNKIIVTGIKTGEDSFRCKKYKNTPYHLVDTVKKIEGNKILIDNRNDGDI